MKRIFPYIVLAAAFSLAGSAAYYSVFGLSKLFSSQASAIIVLAGTLEASKLITASYLHRYWTQISLAIKSYMMVAVFVLMCITSLGIYGFLVSAYQDTAYRLENLETIVGNLNSKKQQYATQVSQIENEKNSVNKNIDQLTNALANNVIQYTDRNGNQVRQTSSANRKTYEAQLERAQTRLDQLTQKQSAFNDTILSMDTEILNLQTSSDVASEIGPLKYIAEITDSSMDQVVNWLIIALIIVFDPLAIILLIAATKTLNRSDIKNNIEVIQEEVSKDNINVTDINDIITDDIEVSTSEPFIEIKEEIKETPNLTKPVPPTPLGKIRPQWHTRYTKKINKL